MSVQCQFKRNALGRLVGLKRPIWAERVSVLWICSRGSNCVKLLFSDSVNAVNANCRCGFWLCFLRSSFRLFCCEKNRLFSGVKEELLVTSEGRNHKERRNQSSLAGISRFTCEGTSERLPGIRKKVELGKVFCEWTRWGSRQLSSTRVGAFFASMSVDGAVSYLLKESCPTQCVTH